MQTSQSKPRKINNLVVAFRVRSSQTRAPHYDANFRIGTLDSVMPEPSTMSVAEVWTAILGITVAKAADAADVRHALGER